MNADYLATKDVTHAGSHGEPYLTFSGSQSLLAGIRVHLRPSAFPLLRPSLPPLTPLLVM